jgi:methionine-rich copper-binding protein CopC
MVAVHRNLSSANSVVCAGENGEESHWAEGQCRPILLGGIYPGVPIVARVHSISSRDGFPKGCLFMKRWFIRLRRLWLAGMLALASTLVMGIWLAGGASAHASFVSSDPAPGTVVATAPTQVSVTFAEEVNPAGADGIPSSLQVYHNSDLTNIYHSDQDAKLVSPENGTQYPLSDAKTMTIPVTGDGDGIYEVYWHTVSADDGDQDSGVFFFGVGTGNVLGFPTTASSTPPATTTTSSGTPIWVTILVGIVGLVLGGLIIGLARRPRTASAASDGTSVTSPSGSTPAEKR